MQGTVTAHPVSKQPAQGVIIESRLTRRVPRGYCLKVSRAKLRDELVLALIVEKQEELERNHGPGNVRILAFGINEMAHIADQLDRLYWSDKDA